MDRLVALAVNRRYLMVGMFVAVIIARLVPQKLPDRASAAGEHADG